MLAGTASGGRRRLEDLPRLTPVPATLAAPEGVDGGALGVLPRRLAVPTLVAAPAVGAPLTLVLPRLRPWLLDRLPPRPIVQNRQITTS